MKKVLVLVLMAVLAFNTFALADTYTLDEVLPSIPSYTDDELDSLAGAISAEQSARAAAAPAEDPAEPVAEVQQIPYEQREDYVERETIQRGSKGDEALNVQQRLIDLGFLMGSADGDFGKKSEAAVLLFQKANGLDETGIADSITQYVLFSDDAVDKATFDSRPVQTGEGWEMLREYNYNSGYYYNYIFVLKNTSGYNADINVDICFFDADGNTVGVANDNEYACENGFETLWMFSNEIEYDHVSVEIKMAQAEYYADGSQSCLEISTSIVGKKAIISAKNNGRKPVEFVEYRALFFNDAGEIVATGWGYLTDDDNEIKPGATIMKEANAYEKFTDVKVYAHGRIDK